ncbi:MAG: formylglycine-generating enzyme family protein [Deinococcales bacterium]
MKQKLHEKHMKGAYRRKKCEAVRSSEYSTNGDQPVNNISWVQAKAYCEWREARLPTEVEWEYAARGPDNLRFPWGNSLQGNEANHCDSTCGNESFSANLTYKNLNHNDGYAGTSPVKSYENGKSWVGAYDIAGNLWEWTSSKYHHYPYLPDDGREEDIGSDSRVLRGGSFNSADEKLRTTGRFARDPMEIDDVIGFRCAR